MVILNYRSLSQQIVETCLHKMSDSETATFSGIGVQISGKPPGGEQAEEQFSLFRAYFDSKLEHLKHEIVSESQASETAKKRKFEEISFKSKSNRIQFNFNCEILDLIDKAEKATKKENKHLKEVKDLITRRNKLIKIADKSPGGWVTVEEYDNDDIASDSDDQRKIRYAENRAIKKMAKSKATSKRFHPTATVSSANFGAPIRQLSDSNYQGPRQITQQSGQQNSERNVFRDFRKSRTPQPTDRCFQCGEPGHWRSFHRQQGQLGTKEEYK